MKETFSGGCTGTNGGQITFNSGTCFQSLNPIRYCGDVSGNPGPASAPSCRTDLVSVTTGGGF